MGSLAVGAIAGAGDEHGVGVVGQAVQAGRGQQWLAEQVGPLRGSAVTGEQDTAPFVALVDTCTCAALGAVQVSRRRGLPAPGSARV